MLGGFVDSLLQTFENSRPGLGDEAFASASTVASFFGEIFERELPRLTDLCLGRETGLRGHDSERFRRDVEKHLRKVVLPAYVRLAQSFTPRERNGFYLVPDVWHGAERVAWAVAGMALGGFVIWAPFIPLWEKEWVAVFALGGLVFPELRRHLAFRRYQSELNRIVTRADDEIFRLDMALIERMASGSAEDDSSLEADVEATPPELEAPSSETEEGPQRRLEGLAAPEEQGRRKKRRNLER
jgi:hypothetical protein